MNRVEVPVPTLPFPLLPPHLVAFDPVVRAMYQGRPIPNGSSSRSPSPSKPRDKPQYFSPAPSPHRKLWSRASSASPSTPASKKSQQAQASPLFIPSRSPSPMDVVMTEDPLAEYAKFEEMCAEMDKVRAELWSAEYVLMLSSTAVWKLIMLSRSPTYLPSLQGQAEDCDWLQFTTFQPDAGTAFSPGSDATYADSRTGSPSTATSSLPHTPPDVEGQDQGYFDGGINLKLGERSKDGVFADVPLSPPMPFTFESLRL